MMTENDIRAEILSVLTTIAPEVEADDIRDDVLLRDQVDLDSMDWLNFLIGIHKRLQRRHPRVGLPVAAHAHRSRPLRGTARNGKRTS